MERVGQEQQGFREHEGILSKLSRAQTLQGLFLLIATCAANNPTKSLNTALHWTASRPNGKIRSRVKEGIDLWKHS